MTLTLTLLLMEQNKSGSIEAVKSWGVSANAYAMFKVGWKEIGGDFWEIQITMMVSQSSLFPPSAFLMHFVSGGSLWKTKV